MVDRQSRAEMADLWRQLIDGSITMGEFSDQAPRDSEDRVVGAALDLFIAGYGRVLRRTASQSTSGTAETDARGKRMVGPYRLCRTERRHLERVVLFLRSDLEYDDAWQVREGREPRWWQVALVLPGALIAVFSWFAIATSTSPAIATAGLIGVGLVAHCIWGTERYWPFRRRSDYKAALAASKLPPGSGTQVME